MNFKDLVLSLPQALCEEFRRALISGLWPNGTLLTQHQASICAEVLQLRAESELNELCFDVGNDSHDTTMGSGFDTMGLLNFMLFGQAPSEHKMDYESALDCSYQESPEVIH